MAHQYSIFPKDPGAHLFEVHLTVAKPDPQGQAFGIPAWIPGSYVIRDYSRHVVGIRAASGGVAVDLRKLDKNSWQAAPVTRPLTLVLDVFAYDASVRGAHLDMTHAYFNGPCVFPVVVGQQDVRCELEILQPANGLGADWRVATSMRRNGAEPYGYGCYVADNYEELIDHPVEIGDLSIGEFEAHGIPHAIAIRGRTFCDMGRLCNDLKVLCEQHLALLGAPADLDRYLFLMDTPADGYGGLEHRWSTSLTCARKNLPRKGQGEVDDAYGTFLGLASHEYFHLWNVKRIRPAAFAQSDLATEAYTELLWVFEGITSYYDDYQLFRSGLITEERYLKLLARTMTRVQRGPGRKRQSVAESSFDAWTKFYNQDANSGNSIVSYYAKGSLIALCLDLKLRLETDGEATLDDVMRACWQRFGETGLGLSESAFEDLCADVTGLDLDDFFDAAVRGTGDLPLDSLLHGHGIAMHWRRATGPEDKGGEKGDLQKAPDVALGAVLAARAGKSVFTSISSGSAAELAGVAPGDEAVALGGLALTAENQNSRLRDCRVGESLPLVVFRGDELLSLQVKLQKAPEDTCYLVIDSAADKQAGARRQAWLQR
jgi:predicted metalloprotease with PDZ domain